MYTVVYVRRAHGIYTVGIADEGECVGYSLTEAEYMSVGAPVRGVTLGEDVYGEIYALDERRRAMKRALSLLGHSDKNRRVMLARLREGGFSRAAAEYATEECLRLGYIDERRQLGQIIPREVNRSLRGNKYVRAKLCSLGYSLSDIDAVISELEGSGEINFYESFQRLTEKKGAFTDEDKGLLARKCGYSRKYID